MSFFGWFIIKLQWKLLKKFISGLSDDIFIIFQEFNIVFKAVRNCMYASRCFILKNYIIFQSTEQ